MRGMVRSTAVMAGLVLVAALALMPARAQATDLYRDISGVELKTLLEAKGATARVASNDWGDPVVFGALGPLRFRAEGFDCAGNPRRCERLDFSAGFAVEGVTEVTLDEFNETWVFGKAYLGPDGKAYVDFPVNLKNGVTRGNMEDNIGLWVDTLRTFADFIGWFEGS